MALEHMESPAPPIRDGNRAKVECAEFGSAPSNPFHDLNQARVDLDRLTDQLEVLADWKDDFRKRKARAEFKFELIGLDPLEQDALTAEANELDRCFRILSSLRRMA
jgi:hypothetical protein